MKSCRKLVYVCYNHHKLLLSQIYTIFTTNLLLVYGLLSLSCCFGWLNKWRDRIRQKHTPSPSLEGSSARNHWNLPFDSAQGDTFWDLEFKN